jgi:threonine aldolase
MGNTIAIKCLTTHGQEVICESRGHLLNYELSMTAWFAGCLIRTIDTTDGVLTWGRIEAAIRPLGPHWAQTGCIELENTHNMAGGTVYGQDNLDDICDRAHAAGIAVHIDGARVFNASEALGIPVSRICGKADTVMFCLSKALGAPAGSMLAGTRELIDRARLYRKRLGGGMRQAGILAAAGLIALEKMPLRLGEDHGNARFLADGLARLPGVTVTAPPTNIVIFDVSGTGRTAQSISGSLKRRGVLINPVNAAVMRAVTHYDVTREQCGEALACLPEVLSEAPSHIR